MPRKLTLLLLPVAGAEPLVGVFPTLRSLLFGSHFDSATGRFEAQVTDELAIRVAVIQVGDFRPAVAIHRLNVIAWPAPEGDCPVFTTCFRDDPDRPDAAILAAGQARFDRTALELPKLDPVYPPLTGAFPPEGAAVTGFEMVFPSRLDLIKPGRFSVAVSLTLRLGEGAEAELQTFRTDPEMNVEGSYP